MIEVERQALLEQLRQLRSSSVELERVYGSLTYITQGVYDAALGQEMFSNGRPLDLDYVIDIVKVLKKRVDKIDAIKLLSTCCNEAIYYSGEHDNFYCQKCRKGQGDLAYSVGQSVLRLKLT